METKTEISPSDQSLATVFNLSTINEVRAFKNRKLLCKGNKEITIDGAVLTESSLDFIENFQSDGSWGIMQEFENLDEIFRIIKKARHESLSDSDFIEIMEHLDWMRDVFTVFINPLEEDENPNMDICETIKELESQIAEKDRELEWCKKDLESCRKNVGYWELICKLEREKHELEKEEYSKAESELNVYKQQYGEIEYRTLKNNKSEITG